MIVRKLIFVVIAVLVSGYFATQANFLTAELISIFLFVFYLLDFIDSIGKSYNPFNISILLAIFQCLLMPLIIYHVYDSDSLVLALKYNMAVNASRYYGYIFPVVIALILGIKIPELINGSMRSSFFTVINSTRLYLAGKSSIGILLMIIGFVSGILQIFIPGELQYVFYLFGKLLYVGALYTYFSDHKSRTLYLGIAVVAILAQSLAQGMFGELVYTSLLITLLLLLGKQVPAIYKYSFAVIGFVFVLLLQSIKADYRDVVWKGQGDQSKGTVGTFISLLSDRMTDPSRFFDWVTLFPMINRFNQGMIVAKVMDYIPSRAPYAEGETIFNSLAASFVPRLLWPDKPLSGGHWNMERFTGFIVEGYSMNISPMGEAYGNYGEQGGIVFMFFYGLFFSGIFLLLIRKAKSTPTILLWFPFLFLNSIQMETDVLMCVNSLLKNLLFMWFCYWAANRFLRLKL